jgi:hypothetical protein
MITYIDLSGEPGYMDEYLAALFIPHTDTDAGMISVKTTQSVAVTKKGHNPPLV